MHILVAGGEVEAVELGSGGDWLPGEGSLRSSSGGKAGESLSPSERRRRA